MDEGLNMKPDNEILLKCECSSSEHQLIIFWDNKEEDVYVSVHLSSYRNFWQRLWHGLKYAFGYKCRYGAFDEVILRKEDAEGIQKVVNHLKGENNSYRVFGEIRNEVNHIK